MEDSNDLYPIEYNMRYPPLNICWKNENRECEWSDKDWKDSHRQFFSYINTKPDSDPKTLLSSGLQYQEFCLLYLRRTNHKRKDRGLKREERKRALNVKIPEI